MLGELGALFAIALLIPQCGRVLPNMDTSASERENYFFFLFHLFRLTYALIIHKENFGDDIYKYSEQKN